MPSGVYTRNEFNNNAKGKHWKLSDETRQKMSISRKGKMPKNIKMLNLSMLNKKFTDEHKNKLSEKAKLRKPNFLGKKHTPETKLKISQKVQTAYNEGRLTIWNKGMSGYKNQPCSEETKKKIRDAVVGKPRPQSRGIVNGNWKGGITPVNTAFRNSLEYRLFREVVFMRDNYTCLECNKRGCELNMHHIKPFSLFPELRLAMDNVITLCVECHKKTDTYLWKCSPRVLNKQK